MKQKRFVPELSINGQRRGRQLSKSHFFYIREWLPMPKKIREGWLNFHEMISRDLAKCLDCEIIFKNRWLDSDLRGGNSRIRKVGRGSILSNGPRSA